jgi:peptide/nickel transport system substrate-binding protein
MTSLAKVTVTYPSGFDGVTWHDGSPLTVGDFVMGMIMTFYPGKEGSPLFDAAAAENLAAIQSYLKGFKVVSADPLVIETYTDLWDIDAEVIPTAGTANWFPQYAYGMGAWHNVGLGVRSETAGELAFSAAKADELEVEWMSFISGPSLELLRAQLTGAGEEGYIPFAATMSEFVTPEEAADRWSNLTSFYAEQGHFWLGTGPFYLDKVFPIEGTLTLLRYEDYPDPATKWARFAAPQLATVEIDGEGSVTIGQEATFDVFITNPAGEPYPQADITGAKWLLFDATGALAASGEATAAEDGLFQVVIPADVTSNLEAGSNKLEVAVSPLVVSVPALAAFDFVTVAP